MRSPALLAVLVLGGGLSADEKETDAFVDAAAAYRSGSFSTNETEMFKAGFRPVDNGWIGPDERKALDPRHASWKDAWEVRTRHFLVRSNNPLERTLERAGELERFYRLFYRKFGDPAGLRRMEDVVVHYFATQEEMMRHVVSCNRIMARYNFKGYFWADCHPKEFRHYTLEQGNTACSHFYAWEGDLKTMFHECAHHLMFTGIADIPKPFKYYFLPNYFVIEGSGVYFELFRDQGRLIRAREMALKGDITSLADFIKIDGKGFHNAQSERNYAQAAGLVFFFMESGSPDLARQFREYCVRVHKGDPAEGLFEAVFKRTPDSFEKEWIAYLTRLDVEKAVKAAESR